MRKSARSRRRSLPFGRRGFRTANEKPQYQKRKSIRQLPDHGPNPKVQADPMIANHKKELKHEVTKTRINLFDNDYLVS